MENLIFSAEAIVVAVRKTRRFLQQVMAATVAFQGPRSNINRKANEDFAAKATVVAVAST